MATHRAENRVPVAVGTIIADRPPHRSVTAYAEVAFLDQESAMFPKLYLLIRPDRADPAVDFVGVKKGVSGGLLKQRGSACGCH